VTLWHANWNARGRATRNWGITSVLWKKASVICLLGICVTQPAFAALHILNYSGIIDNGTDFSGVFTDAGTDLSGKAFLATISYDPDLGLRENRENLDEVKGGTFFSVASPTLGASLTIAGKTYDMGGSWISDLYESGQSTTTYSIADLASLPVGSLFSEINIDFAHPFNPLADLDHPFFGKPLNSRGQFQILENLGGGAQRYRFYAQTLSYTVSSPSTGGGGGAGGGVSGVPEPATWSMFIAGFGLVGASMRRELAKVRRVLGRRLIPRRAG